MSENKPTLYDKLWRRRGWLGKAITLSLLIHGIILIISGSIIILRAYSKPQAQFTSQPPQRPALDPRKLELKVRAADLQKSSARPRLQPRMVALKPSELVLPEIKRTQHETQRQLSKLYSTIGASGFGTGVGGGFGTGMGGGGGLGIQLPKFLSGRCSPMERSIRLRQNGGDQACEDAVLKGLRWLKANQNADGSWGSEAPEAMSGLAVLAFLGHCETPVSEEFGVIVSKGIQYLCKVGASPGGRHAGYQHAITTYALAESYTMTKDPSIVPVLQSAVNVIIKHQGKDGGWRYTYPSHDSDLSVVSWQVQALKAASITGLEFKGLEECLDRAINYVISVRSSDGHFGYQKPGDRKGSLTGAGTLALQFWKHASHKYVREGVNAILKDKNLDYNGGHANLYAWYYNTQACFQRGGSYWSSWNGPMKREITKSQNADGSWPSTGTKSHVACGVGYAGTGENMDAKVYRTCLCILMLEVYYRYLPTTQLSAH